MVFTENFVVKPYKLVTFDRVLNDDLTPFRRPKLLHAIPPRFVASPKRLSSKATSRLNQSIDWLAFLCKSSQAALSRQASEKINTLAFITLTIPATQLHPDKLIKNVCLNHFLTILRQKFGVRHYVWKAELQSNQNIHFHVIIDKYIHHRRIRTLWNNIIGKLGYVRAYQERMQSLDFLQYCKVRHAQSTKSVARARISYSAGLKNDWTDPNSVDVRSVGSVRNLRAYMAKYMAKPIVKGSESGELSEREAAFGGAIWYCSRSLSRLKGYCNLICNRAHDFIKAIAESASCWIGKFDYCTVFRFDPEKIPKWAYDQYIYIMNHQIALSRETL